MMYNSTYLLPLLVSSYLRVSWLAGLEEQPRERERRRMSVMFMFVNLLAPLSWSCIIHLRWCAGLCSRLVARPASPPPVHSLAACYSSSCLPTYFHY